MATDELKLRFKAKMNGLKLSKKVDVGQLQSMIWALNNAPELMDCLYTKPKPFNQKQFDQFWDRLPSEMKKKKKDAMRHWKNLNPNEELFRQIIDALERQKMEKSRLRRSEKFCPEWPTAAAWVFQRRWEDSVDMTPERNASPNPELTACARTAKIIEERESARENRVTNASQAIDPNLRRMLSAKLKLS